MGWNFDDINGFLEKIKGGEFATFTINLIKYIKGEITFDEIK